MVDTTQYIWHFLMAFLLNNTRVPLDVLNFTCLEIYRLSARHRHMSCIDVCLLIYFIKHVCENTTQLHLYYTN